MLLACSPCADFLPAFSVGLLACDDYEVSECLVLVLAAGVANESLQRSIKHCENVKAGSKAGRAGLSEEMQRLGYGCRWALPVLKGKAIWRTYARVGGAGE